MDPLWTLSPTDEYVITLPPPLQLLPNAAMCYRWPIEHQDRAENCMLTWGCEQMLGSTAFHSPFEKKKEFGTDGYTMIKGKNITCESYGYTTFAGNDVTYNWDLAYYFPPPPAKYPTIRNAVSDPFLAAVFWFVTSTPDYAGPEYGAMIFRGW